MKYLVLFVTIARFLLYLACIGAVGWLTVRSAADWPTGIETPTSTRPLKANDRIAAGDLRTPSLYALVGKYMRADLGSDKPVLKDMVDDHPVVPVIPPGVDIVVNVDKQAVQGLDLQPGRSIRVMKDGVALVEAATVVAAPCDATRCAVILNAAKTSDLDPTKLLGVELVPVAANAKPPVK